MSRGDATEHKLSTSAVAKAMQLSLQQLFTTLRDYGWIRKADDGWVLTTKGEFEGGEYIHSKRYGRYIVWPDRVLEHPLLRGLEDNRLWGSAQIARQYGINAREVLRLFGELGLLTRSYNGWALTRQGEQLGGVVVEHDGIPDIQWPAAGLESPFVKAQLEYGHQQYLQADESDQPSLLQGAEKWTGLDGHRLDSRGEWMICNWLYLAGVAHGCRRALPHDAPGCADFWLPGGHVHIEFNGDERDAGSLATVLGRLEHYREHQLAHIEVLPAHLNHLDEYLNRELQRLGVSLF